jgi:hypothetical protein
MKTVSLSQLHHSLSRRYPQADIQILDRELDSWEPGQVDAVYRQFIWQMRLIGLILWLRNKLDCDKWAWLLRAYVIVRNALGKGRNMKALGLVCYLRGGDPDDPHAVCAAIERAGAGYRITEIEPQPDGGRFELTLAERETVWLAIF